MIVRKTIEITTQDLNAVVLELADEIKMGYKIEGITTLPFTLSRDEVPPTVAEIFMVKDWKK